MSSIHSFCIFLILVSSHSLDAQINFKETAGIKGINHTYTFGQSAGGVSFIDFNGDGLDDLTMGTAKGEPIHFYRNTGNGFVRNAPLIGNLEEQKQILWADFDNDGDKDLFVCAKGGINRLYQNNGDLNLVDITESANLPMHSLATFNACWADFNRDGWLDLYVCERIIDDQPNNRNYMFYNNANGTFTDVSEETNTLASARLPFCSSALDINKDNWPDIYIANDRNRGNVMLRNNGGIDFSDVSESSQSDYFIDAMSVALSDYNNDGWTDIYVTNSPAGNILLRNNTSDVGIAQFSNEADSAGVGFYGNAWGANFLDADNDMDQDLYVSGADAGSDKVSAAFYEQINADSFVVAPSGFEKDTVISYANAIGDYDNDGLQDIVVVNYNSDKSFLFENQSVGGNFIKIKLQGVKSNRDGTGCSIDIYTEDKYQYHYTHSGIGFLAQNTDNWHFGIGTNEFIDTIIIKWPTGHIDKLYSIQKSSELLIREGSTTDDEISVDPDITIKEADFPSRTVISSQDDLLIYPNPADNKVLIKSNRQIKSITLKTITGKYLFSQTFKIGREEVNLPTTAYNSGLYILEVKYSDDLLKVNKIMIVH